VAARLYGGSFQPADRVPAGRVVRGFDALGYVHAGKGPDTAETLLTGKNDRSKPATVREPSHDCDATKP